jgi:predicted transcriptional regulator
VLRIARFTSTHLRLHKLIVSTLEANCTMEERLKVLKVMSEVTGRLDLNEFARMVGLNPDQTIEHMQELLKADFVRKIGGGYGITETGRAILKAFAPVPKDMEFHFYMAIGLPTSFTAKSLIEFCEIVKQVPVGSLEFHLYRGDFENWIKTVFNDTALAEELASIKNAKSKGKNLRKGILKAAEARYGFEKLR